MHDSGLGTMRTVCWGSPSPTCMLLAMKASHPSCVNACGLQVARVWDALFSEGSKVLFRTALAVLKAQEDALLAYDNAGAPCKPGRLTQHPAAGSAAQGSSPLSRLAAA